MDSKCRNFVGENPAPATTPVGRREPVRGTTRIQHLEEALARQLAPADRHQQACPLTGPTMAFFQAKWCKVVPGTPPIGYLDLNNYFGYELAAQQEMDRICRWFIGHVVKPLARGGSIQAGHVHPDDHPELGAMMDERNKYWIFQGGGGQRSAKEGNEQGVHR